MKNIRLHSPILPVFPGKKKGLSVLLFLLILLAGCGHPVSVPPDGELSPWMRDSLRYLAERHYTLNSNFEVVSDSLMLKQLPLLDELPIYKGERLVVAEFMIQPADSVDSVWVKVARDQETMGWLHEKELLKRVVPADPISRFINFFTHSYIVVFFVILSIFFIGYISQVARKKRLWFVGLGNMDSVLAILLLWLLAVAATLHAGIRQWAPALWDQFYYAPSLNPLELPLPLALFIANVWGIVWVGLATLDDLFHRARTGTAAFYLFELMAYSILTYLFFTWTTPYYLGYPCLLAYTVWTFFRLRRAIRYKFFCGKCGAKLQTKGTCPRCGAVNE